MLSRKRGAEKCGQKSFFIFPCNVTVEWTLIPTIPLHPSTFISHISIYQFYVSKIYVIFMWFPHARCALFFTIINHNQASFRIGVTTVRQLPKPLGQESTFSHKLYDCNSVNNALRTMSKIWGNYINEFKSLFSTSSIEVFTLCEQH